MPKQTMPVFYVNKIKFKPQVTVEKSEKRFLVGWPYLQYFRFQIHRRWYVLHLVHLVCTRRCRFAHIINEWNLTFCWHVKNSLFSNGKNGSWTIAPEKNCPTTPALTQTVTLTLTGGNFPRVQLPGHR